MDLEQLERISGAGKASHVARRIAGALASAMNDWPTPDLVSIEQFISELKKAFGALSFTNLNGAAKQSLVPSEPWKAEDLADLLDAWDAETMHLTLDRKST